MAGKLALNPWLSIWVRPRETIRAILQYNSGYLLPLLYWIYGFPLLLQCAQNLALGDKYSWTSIVGVAAVAAILVGLIGINISSALFYWTGRWIGGAGSFKEVRAAVAWSAVPSVVNIFIWAIQLTIFGGRLFTRLFAETPFVGVELAAVFLISVTQIVIAIWGFVILLKALAEAQQFSAWKALLNVFMPFIVIFIGVTLLSWIFSLLMSGVH